MPNRILKESIRTSKKVNGLTDFQFRVWAYLITYVDDYGRGSAEPDILKGFVFPRRKGVTEANIRDALSEMACMGLIQLYEVDGESYLCFPNWQEHQTVRAAKSKFPDPSEGINLLQADASSCKQVQANVPVFDNRESIIDNRYSINDHSRSRAENALDGFDDFWAVYPRKVSKQGAIKAWKAAKITTELVERIVEDVKRRCATEWKSAEVQFIPHPSTYLNQRRWEDETPPTERSERTQLDRRPQDNPAQDYAQRDNSTYEDFQFTDLSAYGE
jgi:hypothetical protein